MKNLYYSIGAIFLFTIALSSCKLDYPVTPTEANTIPIKGYYPPDSTGTNPDDPTTPGEYYFTCSLDGTRLNWQTTDGFNGWVTGSAGATSNNQGDITGSLIATISDSKNFQPQIGIEIGNFHVLPDGDRADAFNSLVKPGEWNFGVENNAIDAKFITISYVDATGKMYTSALATQAGTVTIVSATPIPKELGFDDSIKIKLTFSCLLYPVDKTGPPLTLVAGEATVRLENLL
jgi:hypothetical protein